MISKKEIHLLQDFLRKSFHNETIGVSLDPRNTSAAVVQLGEARIGSIAVDDEDGDRSFAFEMKIPVGREVLQDYLRKRFENDKLKILARGKKTDSVELNCGDEHIGVISADDGRGSSYTLQMAILDYDLEGE